MVGMCGGFFFFLFEGGFSQNDVWKLFILAKCLKTTPSSPQVWVTTHKSCNSKALLILKTDIWVTGRYVSVKAESNIALKRKTKMKIMLLYILSYFNIQFFALVQLSLKKTLLSATLSVYIQTCSKKQKFERHKTNKCS